MTRVSAVARIVLALALLAGVVTYLVVVELGVNAGLVHRGVKVGHLDVGGLSQPEATDLIERVGTEMREEPIRLSIAGVGTQFVAPRDFGWKPTAQQKAEEAMEVGRSGGVLAAASERISAWFGRTEIDWDPPREAPLRRQVRRIVTDAREAGVELPWAGVRNLLLDATYDWPRQDSYELSP